MTKNTTRREVLQKLSTLALGSVPLLTVLSGCATTGLILYRGTMSGGVVSLTPSEFPELAEVGGAIQLDIDGSPDSVVVLRLKSDEFFALSPVCTHLGCTVRKERAFFRCPCHGSTYALDGIVVRGPAKERLSPYRVERTDDKLNIYL